MRKLSHWLRYLAVWPGPGANDGIAPIGKLLVPAFGRLDVPDDQLQSVADMYRYYQMTAGNPTLAAVSGLQSHGFDPGPVNRGLTGLMVMLMKCHPGLEVYPQWEILAGMSRSELDTMSGRIKGLWPRSGIEFNSQHLLDAALELGYGHTDRPGVLAHDRMAIRVAFMVNRQLNRWPTIVPADESRWLDRSVHSHTTSPLTWLFREAVGRLVILPARGLI